MLTINRKFYIYFKRKQDKHNSLVKDYVLPDYNNIRCGYVKSQADLDGKSNIEEQVRFILIFH